MKRIYETERLYTREMTPDDLPALSAILQDEATMYAYEGAFREDETLNWLYRQQDRYAQDGYGLWAVIHRESGEMIGQCGLTIQQFDGQPVLEIGYLFQRARWRRGYATEAARGCKRYAFEQLHANELYSIIRDSNLASMNVAIRNGMLVRGRFVKHYRGIDMPHYAFSIRREEYRSGEQA